MVTKPNRFSVSGHAHHVKHQTYGLILVEQNIEQTLISNENSVCLLFFVMLYINLYCFYILTLAMCCHINQFQSILFSDDLSLNTKGSILYHVKYFTIFTIINSCSSCWYVEEHAVLITIINNNNYYYY